MTIRSRGREPKRTLPKPKLKRVWSVDISVRIDDPQTGERVGVMKSVLGVSLLQEVADMHAAQVQDGTVTVLNPDGLLLAETASGHDLTRIMNAEVNLRDSNLAAVAKTFATDDASGYDLGEETVAGFARTAEASFYRSVPGFEGFGWAVIVQQPTEVAFAPLDSLNALGSDLSASRQTVGSTIMVMVLLVAAGALALAFFLSRSITVPISQLRDVAEKVSLGDLSIKVSVDSHDEISDLAAAFERMVTAVRVFAAEAQSEEV